MRARAVTVGAETSVDGERGPRDSKESEGLEACKSWDF